MRLQFKKRVLLSGQRHIVASGILLLMIGIVLIPALTGFTIRNTTPLTYMASALITGNITLITIVVAINQVILSQELESPGSLRDEIERTAEYRQVALDQETTPTNPSDFLHQLFQQTCQDAFSLEDLLPRTSDPASDHLITDLPNYCKRISDQLESASGNLSHVVVPILGVNYGDDIRRCHQLQAKYGEDDHEQLHRTLDQLTSDLENLDVARQYFTTIFMKEELATLSQTLLYVGIFAVSAPIALLFELTTYTGSSPPMPNLFIPSLLTLSVGLLPLAFLIAFILRVATVAKEIAAISPFTS